MLCYRLSFKCYNLFGVCSSLGMTNLGVNSLKFTLKCKLFLISFAIIFFLFNLESFGVLLHVYCVQFRKDWLFLIPKDQKNCNISLKVSEKRHTSLTWPKVALQGLLLPVVMEMSRLPRSWPINIKTHVQRADRDNLSTNNPVFKQT